MTRAFVLGAVVVVAVGWKLPQAPHAPPTAAEVAALAQPPARTPIASQRIYFVMTDRYANGDPGNDRGGRTGTRGVHGYDPTDIGWFHGGDFKGLTGDCTGTKTGLARIKDLGFTSIWVTPPYGQRAVQGSSAAYHGYWIQDFTRVDPHLGTDADFAAFVDCAHRLGLKVILDVVVNHTADVILPTGGATYSDARYRDCRGRPFSPARYVTAKAFPCLGPTTMPRPPLLLPADRNAKRPAWLNDVRRYHNRGDVNFESCSETCFEQGDFFGLDDLFTEQPVVMNGLARIYGDWIRKYKIDGFRIDTARHVNKAFFRLWTPKIMAAARAAGVPHFEIFGEAYIGNATELAPFVRERGLPNVLDFPLQDAAVGYAAADVSARAISSRLDDDDYFGTANGRAHTPPTFLGNHDMGRAALLIKNRSGVGGPQLVQRVLLGHSLLYLLRGAPVVYYGDEVGIVGTGGDKQARQDMFPTQVREWQREERVGAPPIGTGSSFDVVAHPVGEHLRALGKLRDAHPALATGSTIVRRAQGGVLVVSRIDAQTRREYLVAFNSGTAAAHVTVPTSTPSATWEPLFASAQSPASAPSGAVALEVPPVGAVVWRALTELPARAPAAPVLRVTGDDLTESWRVAAATGGNLTVSVSFAVLRAKAKRWQRLAADDSPPYRAFIDPRRFRRNEKVQLVAIARTLDGRTAVSSVVPFTVRRR